LQNLLSRWFSIGFYPIEQYINQKSLQPFQRFTFSTGTHIIVKKRERDMSQHSYNKLWIHFIWETQDKQKLFTPEARTIISRFLYDYSKEKNIFMKINYVNADHVHTLVDLPTNLSVEECVKLLKGSSSYYINKNRIIRNKFSWGKGY
jgi:REP element-mobilizing transposase RayT